MVGFNDTSVMSVKIDPETGRPVTSSTEDRRKDVFTEAATSMGVLDIEE
jgi:hypothetical protein